MPALEKELPEIARRSYLGYQSDRLGRIKFSADKYTEELGTTCAPWKSFRQTTHDFLSEDKHWSVGFFSGNPISQNPEMMFTILSTLWQNDVGSESSLSKITANKYYLRIISYGDLFLPFILKQLQIEPAPWFVALEAITGNYGVGKQYAGNFRKIAEEWVKWGKNVGLI